VGPAVYSDGAGAALLTQRMSNNIANYTCQGGSAIVPDSSCDGALSALQGIFPFTNAICTTGTCTF
jgi:hypothetical protein